MITAYAVPLRVDRLRAPHRYHLVNVSNEELHGLRVSLLGSGVILPISRLRVPPGGRIAVIARGRDLPRTAVLVVRWFRPNGEEFLWRVSF